jgi:hypothetical protein
MDVKNARHEKFVIGSFGSSLVGKPSSSTSGGCAAAGANGGSIPESFDSCLDKRIGGGAASSESESPSCFSCGLFSSSFSSGAFLECARQKLKKLGGLAKVQPQSSFNLLQLLLLTLEVDNLLDLLQLQQLQDQRHIARVHK